MPERACAVFTIGTHFLWQQALTVVQLKNGSIQEAV